MNPLISIIIPCFNQAHFLDDAIQSVLNQGYPNIEIIIVNDGSTDETRSRAESWSKKDLRINVINQNNKGLSAARNAGIQHAKGQYLHFLDADDFLLEGFYTSVEKVLGDESLIQVGYKYLKNDTSQFYQTVLPATNFTLPKIFEGNLGPCHAMLISRKLALSIGPFDVNLKSAEDWDYWLRAIKAGANIRCIRKPLVAYRYVSDSMSRDGFVLYNSLKTVALRAPKKDPRLKIESKYNRDYEFDVRSVIKRALIQSLGISVMQGKILESIELFHREREALSLSITEKDFGLMCSYLSFRYWYSKDEIDRVFKDIYPNFEIFFKSIQIENVSSGKALNVIFARHKAVRRKMKWGFWGRILNKINK